MIHEDFGRKKTSIAHRLLILFAFSVKIDFCQVNAELGYEISDNSMLHVVILETFFYKVLYRIKSGFLFKKINFFSASCTFRSLV